MIFISLLFNVILNFQSTKMILGFNIFSIFILSILIYAKFYTKFSLNLRYNITQHKCLLLWLFNCCHFKFHILIVLFCIKCLQLPRLKAKSYIYFISLEFCELIRENCDEFVSFILNALFYIAILIYFSLHAVFLLTLKFFSHISFIYAFCNRKVLMFLSFLTFLFAIFNNSPYSTYVYDFCIVSFDVIRPLPGLGDKQGFTKFLTILPVLLVLLLQLISM